MRRKYAKDMRYATRRYESQRILLIIALDESHLLIAIDESHLRWGVPYLDR
jgi:hypothetical protein